MTCMVGNTITVYGCTKSLIADKVMTLYMDLLSAGSAPQTLKVLVRVCNRGFLAV